jgi:hypothetical protein
MLYVYATGLVYAGYGAPANGLMSVRWAERPVWSIVSSVLVLSAFLMTLNLIDDLDVNYWAVPLVGLGWVFLAAALLARRRYSHATVGMVSASTVAIVALFMSFVTAELPVMLISLPLIAALFAAQSMALHRVLGPTINTAAKAVVQTLGTEKPESVNISRWSNAILLTVAAVLVPIWSGILVEWAGIEDLWVGLDQLVLAIVFGAVALRLAQRGSMLVASLIGAIAATLVVLAPIYNISVVGEPTWVMTGMLYVYATGLVYAGYGAPANGLMSVRWAERPVWSIVSSVRSAKPG